MFQLTLCLNLQTNFNLMVYHFTASNWKWNCKFVSMCVSLCLFLWFLYFLLLSILVDLSWNNFRDISILQCQWVCCGFSWWQKMESYRLLGFLFLGNVYGMSLKNYWYELDKWWCDSRVPKFTCLYQLD